MKENAFDRGETYCGYCKYLHKELSGGDPALGCDSLDGFDYECAKPNSDRLACANAARAEKAHLRSQYQFAVLDAIRTILVANERLAAALNELSWVNPHSNGKTEAAKDLLNDYLKHVQKTEIQEFSNGRLVREKVILSIIPPDLIILKEHEE